MSLERDARHRLHSATDMAIKYPDGWGLYAWHGVRVPEKVIRHPFDLTVQEITNEKNIEIRRIMLERYGAARYLLDIGAKKIHQDHYGSLYRAELLDDEPLVMVRVLNSTPEWTGEQKSYWLRVPPQMTTAHDAVAWTFGQTAEYYGPIQET